MAAVEIINSSVLRAGKDSQQKDAEALTFGEVETQKRELSFPRVLSGNPGVFRSGCPLSTPGHDEPSLRLCVFAPLG